MKKFFTFGKKKKKENDLKEKEEEGYDAVDDDYNEDGDDDTATSAPAPVTRRDSRARFSTSLPSVHGGSGESVPTQHGRSSGLATSSAAGSSPPSSSPATRPHASTVAHYASSSSSAGHVATSAAAGTSSPSLVTSKPFEGLGIGGAQAGDRSSIGRGSVERKVAAFSAFQAAQAPAPAPGPNAATKERSVTMNSRPSSSNLTNQVPSGGGAAAAAASAAAASGAPRPTRRVELQRTRYARLEPRRVIAGLMD